MAVNAGLRNNILQAYRTSEAKSWSHRQNHVSRTSSCTCGLTIDCASEEGATMAIRITCCCSTTGAEGMSAHDALVPTADLKPNPGNPNQHAPEQLKLYAKIILHQGWRRSVVVSNRSGLIVTGHGAWLTAQAEGWPTVPVDYQDFKTRADEFAHLIADNKLPQMAEIDDVVLAKILADEFEDNFDLSITGIGQADLDALSELSGAESSIDAEPQIDHAAALQKKWKTASGQLWELGEHRLLCGDCTDRENLNRLLGAERVDMVFTDPPYGHNNNNGDLIHNREAALGKRKTKSSAARPIANDGPEANELVKKMFAEAARLLKPGCCCCCCCGGGGGPDPQFARWSLWLDEQIPFKMCVIWDKGGLGMGWHYRRNWECILVAQQPGAAAKWYGGNDVPNIIREIGKIIPSAEDHPTPKPVELPAWFLRLHSQKGDIVFDPFGGGGSTLIACERLARRCRAIEISPGYCAVILQRFQDATGKKPALA